MKNIATTILGLTLLSQSSHAVARATFTETGPDIFVSISGTFLVNVHQNELVGHPIDPNSFDGPNTTGATHGSYNNNSLVFANINTGYYYLNNFGSVSLPITGSHYDQTNPSTLGSFGLQANGNMFFGVNTFTPNGNGDIDQLTFNPAENSFFIRGKTLSDMGLDTMPNDTVIYTATSTADTIVFRNGATVPEPSSSVLVALGGMALLLRRRK